MTPEGVRARGVPVSSLAGPEEVNEREILPPQLPPVSVCHPAGLLPSGSTEDGHGGYCAVRVLTYYTRRKCRVLTLYHVIVCCAATPTYFLSAAAAATCCARLEHFLASAREECPLSYLGKYYNAVCICSILRTTSGGDAAVQFGDLLGAIFNLAHARHLVVVPAWADPTRPDMSLNRFTRGLKF